MFSDGWAADSRWKSNQRNSSGKCPCIRRQPKLGEKRRWQYSTLCETHWNVALLIIATFPSNRLDSSPCPKLPCSHSCTNAKVSYDVCAGGTAFNRQFCDRRHLCDQCKSIRTVRQLTIDATRRGLGVLNWRADPGRPGVASLRSRCHILLATPISRFSSPTLDFTTVFSKDASTSTFYTAESLVVRVSN